MEDINNDKIHESCELRKQIIESGKRYAELKLNLYRNRVKLSHLDMAYSELFNCLRCEVDELEEAMIEVGMLTKSGNNLIYAYGQKVTKLEDVAKEWRHH